MLDKDGSGQVTIDDIRMAYDVSFHPDFQSGHKTADEILDSVRRFGQRTIRVHAKENP